MSCGRGLITNRASAIPAYLSSTLTGVDEAHLEHMRLLEVVHLWNQAFLRLRSETRVERLLLKRFLPPRDRGSRSPCA